jgi:hypothetical protein
LDRYRRDDDDLWFLEREVADPAAEAAFRAPAFAAREITAATDFTGAALARRFGARSPWICGAP